MSLYQITNLYFTISFVVVNICLKSQKQRLILWVYKLSCNRRVYFCKTHLTFMMKKFYYSSVFCWQIKWLPHHSTLALQRASAQPVEYYVLLEANIQIFLAWTLSLLAMVNVKVFKYKVQILFFKLNRLSRTILTALILVRISLFYSCSNLWRGHCN